MRTTLTRFAARSLARTMAWLKSKEHFRELYASLLYERVNREQFASLEEQEKMLADGVRLDAYSRAIAKYVHPGATVLDVGTGTGVLSFLAARRDPRKVYALDHSRIIETARLIAEKNGIRNVEFVNSHSKSFDPPEKVDVIVHEQIGSALFNENMIETLVDLRERVLKPGGRVLPARFALYMEPVKIEDEYRVPFVWDHAFQGVDYGCLREAMRTNGRTPKVMRLIQKADVDFLLATPEPLFTCDLETMGTADLPREFRARRRVERDGRLDGFCLYFTAAFDDEISFGTLPDRRRTHWSTPLFRLDPRTVRAGDELELRMAIGDVCDVTTWTVGLA
jgi:protein arginine N-methyltransferase 1